MDDACNSTLFISHQITMSGAPLLYLGSELNCSTENQFYMERNYFWLFLVFVFCLDERKKIGPEMNHSKTINRYVELLVQIEQSFSWFSSTYLYS